MIFQGTLAADVITALSIAFLFAVASSYRNETGSHARWPMDWGLHDKPLWTARRDIALFAFPSLMSLTMLVLALMSRGQANEGGVFILRAVPALLACAVHWTYLRRAVVYVRPRRPGSGWGGRR